MPAKNIKGAKSGKRRTEVKDLPKQNKKLSKDELKKVKGGQADARPQPEAVPHLIRIIE